MASNDSRFQLTVEQAVARVREREEAMHAFVTTRLDDALRDAKQLATQPIRSPLHALPYALKDEWETTVLPTTGGSLRHAERRPARDSLAFEVFRDAGGVLIGKTNLSDLGLAPEATNYLVGPTHNPHDLQHTAGGSSGGAAAAVADGMVAFDWGTDIGGSIRMPAAFCEVLGMRLSSETWPIRDLFPVVPEKLNWMCGQGPFTHTTAQMRAVLDVAAPRLRARTAAFQPRRILTYLPPRMRHWPDFLADAMPHLQAAIDAPVEDVADALPGCDHVRQVYGSVWASHLDELVTADDTLSFAEGARGVLSSVFLRGAFGDRRFHPSTAELLMLMAIGRVTIFRSKQRALANADAVRAQFRQVWEAGSLIAAPVCVVPPPRIGRGNRTLDLLTCTLAGNLADATAIAIPLGRFGNLPRAIQLMGPPGCENVLLDLADRFIASRDAATAPHRT